MSIDGINPENNGNFKLPNKLDLSQFDGVTKRILSFYDTDNQKGFLSKQEMQKALFELSPDVTGEHRSFNDNHEGLVSDLESLSSGGKSVRDCVRDYINNALQALLKAIKQN